MPINPTIWLNANGTWSHHRDSKREWNDRVGCETDLRFTREHDEPGNYGRFEDSSQYRADMIGAGRGRLVR